MERSWPGFFFLALSCPFNPSLPPSPSFSFSSLSLFLFYAHLFVMFGCSFFFSSFFFFFLCLLAPILVHHVAFFNLSTHTHTYTHIYISSSRSFSLWVVINRLKTKKQIPQKTTTSAHAHTSHSFILLTYETPAVVCYVTLICLFFYDWLMIVLLPSVSRSHRWISFPQRIAITPPPRRTHAHTFIHDVDVYILAHINLHYLFPFSFLFFSFVYIFISFSWLCVMVVCLSIFFFIPSFIIHHSSSSTNFPSLLDISISANDDGDRRCRMS